VKEVEGLKGKVGVRVEERIIKQKYSQVSIQL
jgi:hypothetical protein